MHEGLPRLKGANGLRGLACLIVLVVHAVVAAYPPILMSIRGSAKIGVWLFFSLSAFLLTRQMLYTGMSHVALMGYGLQRTLRIYPLYIVFVLIYFAAGWNGLNSWSDVASALALSKGYGHFWTIPVEFKFYILLPLIVCVLRASESAAGPSGVFGATVAFTVLHQLIWPYWETPELSPDLMPYLPVFVFGVAAAFLYDRPSPAWLPQILISAIILFLMIATLPFFRKLAFGIPYSDYLNNKFLFYGIGFSFIIWSTAGRENKLERIFEWRPLDLVGRWSYSIYLCHIFVIIVISRLFESLAANPPLYALAAIVLSLVVGACVYVAIERPLMNVRERINLYKPWLGLGVSTARNTSLNV